MYTELSTITNVSVNSQMPVFTSVKYRRHFILFLCLKIFFITFADIVVGALFRVFPCEGMSSGHLRRMSRCVPIVPGRKWNYENFTRASPRWMHSPSPNNTSFDLQWNNATSIKTVSDLWATSIPGELYRYGNNGVT